MWKTKKVTSLSGEIMAKMILKGRTKVFTPWGNDFPRGFMVLSFLLWVDGGPPGRLREGPV